MIPLLSILPVSLQMAHVLRERKCVLVARRKLVYRSTSSVTVYRTVREELMKTRNTAVSFKRFYHHFKHLLLL